MRLHLLTLVAALAAGSSAQADDAQKLGRFEPGSAQVEDARHGYRGGYSRGYNSGYYGGYGGGYYGGGYGGGYGYRGFSFGPAYYGGYGYRNYYAPRAYYAPYYYAPQPYYYGWYGINNAAPRVSLSLSLGGRQLPFEPTAPAPRVEPPTPFVPREEVVPNLNVSNPAKPAMKYPAYGDRK